jgi:uncharacterized protein (TIGR02646 family)
LRAIAKGQEPPSLTAHRQTPHCDYDNYADKDQLREKLVAEQRGLCCYCMRRIENDPEEMKIEHWRCQSNPQYSHLVLSYGNLLGACLGGQGKPWERQHCDTRKGDLDLRWNPANPDHQIERRLRYEPNGSIRSDDPEFDRQLDEVLNLNLTEHCNSRRAIFEAILDWWKRERNRLRGPVAPERIQRKRDEYAAAAGELRPYCQVAVWLLDQRLLRTGR